ncbi:hypothetical protein HPB50_017515 [Hyalomma asiaticum]|uniref:Uncharacterized protein n=1 Tax=Hyalomma asiaticum TaxID=266040 RepID=A0ACB7SIV3_HYAAI|nr:hypothetical protein HPB50_017515 [Hyalomma asiaticum]
MNTQQATSNGAVGGAAAASEAPADSFTVECGQCLAETPFGDIIDLLWCGHLLCRRSERGVVGCGKICASYFGKFAERSSTSKSWSNSSGNLTIRWLDHVFAFEIARAEVLTRKSRLDFAVDRTARPKRRSCSGAWPEPWFATAPGHVLLEDKGHRRRQTLLMVSCGVATLVCVATVMVVAAVVVTATTPAPTGVATSEANTTAASSVVADGERKARGVASRGREGARRAPGSFGKRQPEWRLGRQTTLDPRETWSVFLRHSERTQTVRPKKKIDKSFLRMEGPQGPPGPRGPRGPPGANITREEMFRQFKELLREAADRRAQVMAEMQCKNSTNCTVPLSGGVNGSDSLLPWLPPLVEIDRASMLPRAQSGFFWELSDEVRARKGKELRLHPFHRPFAEGSFERGTGLNATRGMFRAPLNGLYVFFATVFASRPTAARALRKQLETSANDASLIVCVNARCQKNLSLRTTGEFSDGEYTMSLSVNGPLMLRAGQVVSLWFHNRTPYQITIHEGSQFSGFLAGL